MIEDHKTHTHRVSLSAHFLVDLLVDLFLEDFLAPDFFPPFLDDLTLLGAAALAGDADPAAAGAAFLMAFDLVALLAPDFLAELFLATLPLAKVR